MPLSRNLGTLTSWNPLGSSGSVTGLLYLFLDVSNTRRRHFQVVTVLECRCSLCPQVLKLPEDGCGSWPKCETTSELCTLQLVCNQFVYSRSCISTDVITPNWRSNHVHCPWNIDHLLSAFVFAVFVSSNTLKKKYHLNQEIQFYVYSRKFENEDSKCCRKILSRYSNIAFVAECTVLPYILTKVPNMVALGSTQPLTEMSTRSISWE